MAQAPVIPSKHPDRPAISPESSDQELLDRFIACREEAAFALLVQRHSGAVWSVCRRALHREQDAEDAFQAVFILLARKAGSIRNREAVGSWLYGVAYRAAMHARRSADRRQDRERQASEPPAAESPCSAAAFRELQQILDEEVQHLPEKHRAPFVLCCLEGLSKSEAARALGWKEGTVSGRVTRARQQLQKRLARRGVSLAAALTTVALTPNIVSAAARPALVHATIQGVLTGQASTTLSPAALALADGCVRTLTGLKLKIGLAIVLALLMGVASQADLPRAGPEEPQSEFYHDFRGGKPLPPVFKRVGVDARSVIQPENGGLRILLPANRKRTDKAGVKLAHRLTGDFEITTGFEILHLDRPTGERGVGFSLYLTTETPLQEGLGLERLVRAREGDILLFFHMTTGEDGRQHYKHQLHACSLRSGQLRMIRIADKVTCWTAEEGAGPFRPQPGRQVFGSAVEAVQLVANPGFTNHVVDLRIKDLRIRKLTPDESRAIASKRDATAPLGTEGDDREPEATRSRRWLLLGLLGFLLLPTASVVWLWTHRRREKDRSASPPGAASAPLAVQCSGCEKKFRARAELAGKRVKCPQCGQAVLVPGLVER